MSTSENNPQHVLVTYAVLTGLTPLIPIPLVDDLFYSHFLRAMVRRLAAYHGRNLTKSEIDTLISEPGGGCAAGCFGGIILYPLKKLFEKLFYFLEWKRAADIISHTYYQGYLLDTVLAQNWLEGRSAAQVRGAIDRVLARTNTSLVARSAYGVVRQSKSVLQGLGKLLIGTLRRGKRHPSDEEVAAAVANVEGAGNEGLVGIAGQLQASISKVPADHFLQLQRELAAELGVSLQ